METGEILQRADYQPDEVISYFLNALKSENWDRFFLYVDLESILKRSSYHYRRYIGSNESVRKQLLEHYRELITRREIPEVSSLTNIPDEFEIVRTTYTKTTAEVLVKESFRWKGFTPQTIRYTYDLHRVDGVWKIRDLRTYIVREQQVSK